MPKPIESATAEDALIERALAAASDTRFLAIRAGARHDAAAVFRSHFGSQPAILVADENTLAAAGQDVFDSFASPGQSGQSPFIFGPHVSASEECALELVAALTKVEAVPIAVGSGTINDLTKLAAHRLNRPYMIVATAASMDGYTAYGASITAKGSKQTFDCPAPKVVLADLDVIASAPAELNAAGYADLVAKIPAGADWMLADAAQVEAINSGVWETVQGLLHSWIEAPAAIARRDPARLRQLTCGLMMSGFAMQSARSSRPASGAEHQFSHLWDMQHHMHQGVAPSHGFKVGIGTLASTALYENLLARKWKPSDIDAAIKNWPASEALEQQISFLFEPGELREKALAEMQAKYPSPQELRNQLSRLVGAWPDLKARLQRQLLPFHRLQELLSEAGCPTQPEQIGISRDRLKLSYAQAICIRRRFTVLDVAHRAGLFDESLVGLFASGGPWAVQ